MAFLAFLFTYVLEKLLKDMGTLIKENIRDIDLGARCKEKQFAIVLASTDGDGANIVAERLKGLIQNYLSYCQSLSSCRLHRKCSH